MNALGETKRTIRFWGSGKGKTFLGLVKIRSVRKARAGIERGTSPLTKLPSIQFENLFLNLTPSLSLLSISLSRSHPQQTLTHRSTSLKHVLKNFSLDRASLNHFRIIQKKHDWSKKSSPPAVKTAMTKLNLPPSPLPNRFFFEFNIRFFGFSNLFTSASLWFRPCSHSFLPYLSSTN